MFGYDLIRRQTYGAISMSNNLGQSRAPVPTGLCVAVCLIKHPDTSKLERQIGVCGCVRTYLVGATIGRPFVRLTHRRMPHHPRYVKIGTPNWGL